MSLKRLDHVAFRVSDIKPVVRFYTETMGFKIVQELEMDLDGSKAISNVLNLPGTPFYIFVDQGMDWDNIITQWVKKHGGGLHHIAYLVDNIEKTSAEMRKQGMTFTTKHVIDTGGGLKQLFSTPNPDTGIIIELIQRYNEDIFFVQGNVIELIKSTKGM